MKKNISKTIFKLILANKKVFLKNQIFLFLFIKKFIIIISNIVKAELFIYYLLISFFEIKNQVFNIN